MPRKCAVLFPQSGKYIVNKESQALPYLYQK